MAQQGVIFSHWRGAPKWEGLHADTSCGIVLNAIRASHPAVEYLWVTNNHFDVDGFLGVWSLFEPALALRYAHVLVQAATIGDFREFDPEQQGADQALKLVCWLNAEEKKHFYAPFGAKDEATACVPKYAYFLPRFAEVLSETDRFSDSWGPEYERVIQDRKRIKEVVFLPEIRLSIVHAPEPLHYYALFGESYAADVVLSLYGGQRYELEYKYTTWVDTATRTVFPRLPQEPLVHRLNERETTGHRWRGEGIMDTGPLVRLGSELPKAQRYAHPFEREIVPSSLHPEEIEEEVRQFLQTGYQGIRPRAQWTWQEMRDA